MTGWRRPDVVASARDHLAQVVGPTSAQQMVDGLIDLGRKQRDEEVEKLQARIAGLEKGSAVEYGIRVPDTTWPEDGVLLDGNTFSRQEQVDRLARYRDCWPGAELVTRTVHYGDWETDTEGGESR